MKSFILAGILGFLTLLISPLSMAKQEQKVAFLVRQPNHLKAAFLTLDQMNAGKFSLDYQKAVIVVCGPKGVSALKKNSAFEKNLAEMKSKNVKVKACGLSLNKMNLSREALSEGVEVVENGLYEMIRLKSEGFISVDL